jgi:hypothetical protein
MKAYWSISAIALVVAACAASPVQSPSSAGFYLDAIVSENGMNKFPDPIHPERLEGRLPGNLREAINSLEIITPIKPIESTSSVKACSIEPDELLSDAYVRCVYDACKLLPTRSQVQDCGYITRLAHWVQRNWLGGFCVLHHADKSYPLSNWFITQGITECDAMSELIMFAYMQRITGIDVNEQQLIQHSKKDSEAR